MNLWSWLVKKLNPRATWRDVRCPDCQGRLEELVPAVCVDCGQPCVVAPHRAGKVMKQRTVAPEERTVKPGSRKGDQGESLQTLERALAEARTMEEPR